MLKDDTARDVAEAIADVGASAEQAAIAAQKLADVARKTLPEIKPAKPRRVVEVCTCAICHRGDVTLLKREGTYVCGPCYQKLLTLRVLEKQ